MKAGMQRTRGLQASAIVFGALMVLSAIAGAALAAPAEKVTICHANNAATNPYVQQDVPLSSVDGEGNNDHTLHTGPVAVSEEHAAQLKADDIEWGDIIPPFGGFPGLNWDETGQAIYENGCEYETTTTDDGTVDDGTVDDGTVDDGTVDDGSTDDGTADGSTDDGSTDDGSTDDGSTDDGSADDGTADGSTDDGSTDDGSTDDGTADGSTDGSTDGSSDGSSDDASVEGNVIVKPKPRPEVEGRNLAQTGPETTVLSIIGSLLLMAGLAMRYGFRRPTTAFAVDVAGVAEALDR